MTCNYLLIQQSIMSISCKPMVDTYLIFRFVVFSQMIHCEFALEFADCFLAWKVRNLTKI